MQTTQKTALLVIDVQESFRHRPYFTTRDVNAFLDAQNALIEACSTRAIPVVRVFHVEQTAHASNPFALDSGLIRPLQGLLDFNPAATFHKHKHSALAETGLPSWLVTQGVRRLIISGIRTEQCCETTARHASDSGWEVLFPSAATLTFDMLHLDGSIFSSPDIKARTSAVLHTRFAQVSDSPDMQRVLDNSARGVQ